jgi:hypothetical protein
VSNFTVVTMRPCSICAKLVPVKDPKSTPLCRACSKSPAITRLTRREIIVGFAQIGAFPSKFGYREIIRRVRTMEAWQAKREHGDCQELVA